MIDSQYLLFVRQEYPNRKTPIVEVISRSKGALLGKIKWYGSWRQYCFYPEDLTIFNKGCMLDVLSVIDILMQERSAQSFVGKPVTANGKQVGTVVEAHTNP